MPGDAACGRVTARPGRSGGGRGCCRPGRLRLRRW